MTKPTDIRIATATSHVEHIAYRAPMKFGGRVVTEVLVFDVVLKVETRDGRIGMGIGSMPLGNVWAWPSSTVPASDTLEAIRRLAERLVLRASIQKEFGHPLELTSVLEHHYEADAALVCEEMKLAEPMPRLAQLLANSPLEAALYEAYGRAIGMNSYNALGPEFVNHDLGETLGADFAGEYLDRYTLREPKPRMPLYHLVGALDPLTEADIPKRINDGLPETLPEWTLADGLTHFKIKLAGDDLDWDVARVTAIDSVLTETQAQRKQAAWWYSLDFNEKCASVDYVLEFLRRIQEERPGAYERIQYIEQPTHRDLRAHPENRMHKAAALKPVVIDESLVDLESLLMAREQGYSGIALKACKGHSGALLMAAAAQKYGMFLCVQDLTCPGRSFLHSSSLAARIPGVAAIEGNGRQYCPAGNADWEGRHPGLFQITDGTLATETLIQTGLGF